MKDKRQKQKEKAKIISEKLKQKKEHLQDLKKEQEKKRELGFDRMRRTRNELFKKIQSNKKQLERIEFLRRSLLCSTCLFNNSSFSCIPFCS